MLRHAQPSESPAQSPVARLDLVKPLGASAHVHVQKTAPFWDMHYGLELGVVLKGKMRRYFTEHRYDCRRGDVWLCGMWEPHGFQVVAAPCEVLVVVVSPEVLSQLRFQDAAPVDWLAPFAAEPAQRPTVTNQAQRKRLIACAERLRGVSGAAEGDMKAEWWVRLLLLEILLILLEEWPAPAAAEPLTQAAACRINKAIRRVLSSRELVTTEEAARLSGMNRKAFARLFREMMGLRFAEFDLRHRISGAAAQLLQTETPLKAVAREWGFTDASHFHHCFVRCCGCSPGEYRKRGG